MRVAVYSPLPPQRSGIADYTAELLPELARHAALELVVEPEWTLPPELAAWPQRRPEELPGALARRELDVVLYHLGNNADYHTGIWRTALAVPGVVVLHEFVLHHLVRGLAQNAGDLTLWVRELARAYGEPGALAARRALDAGVPLDPFHWPLFERIVDRSLALIVHSETARQRVLRSRPRARIALVPMHVMPCAAADLSREEARSRLGLPLDAPLVGTFGLLTPIKRPHVLLGSFREVRAALPEARLLIVGEVSPYLEGAGEIAAEPGVTLLGHQPLDDFLLWSRAVDVAVNLRHPTAGETSAAVMRLLGLGQAVVVSDSGSLAELPDRCCAKVPVDDAEEEVLTATLIALLTQPSLRAAMGENARRLCQEQHLPATSARGYAELLAAVLADPRPPAAELADLALPGATATDLWGRVLVSTGRELVDLGCAERDASDEAILRAVATAVAELQLRVAR